MKQWKKLSDIKLLRALCDIDAPSGAERPVREAIAEVLADLPLTLTTDAVGNLLAHRAGSGRSRRRLLLSAHMDEVGFMITGIDEDGRLRFDNIGGIDISVLSGRAVRLLGKRGPLEGVISAPPVHLRNQEERKKPTPQNALRIDIGAVSREDAADLLSVGAVGTFRSEFTEFGDGRLLCGKAIDDRIGCAILCDLLRLLEDEPLDFELYCAFTTREEIGYSGAFSVAERIAPDLALVLEATAVADLADVPGASRVGVLGGGPAVSFADRGTIYSKKLFDFILNTADQSAIPAQAKRFASGGNDAACIHTGGRGVTIAALSVPTRYLHSASCVAAREDYFSLLALLPAILRGIADSECFSEAEE